MCCEYRWFGFLKLILHVVISNIFCHLLCVEAFLTSRCWSRFISEFTKSSSCTAAVYCMA